MSRIPGAIVLAIVLLLSLASASLYAQRGHHGGGAAVGSATGVHTPPGSSFAGHPAPVGRPPATVGRPVSVFSAPAIHRPIVRPQPFGFYPSYGYSPYFWSTAVGAPVYAEPAYTTYTQPAYNYAQSPVDVTQAPPVSQTESDLTYQVGVLSQQIEQLRQEQAQRSLPPAPAVSANPAVLVFRDGHRLEIQNYAIVGNTVWVLDEKTSKKISVDELDLDATQNENRSHGVRFPLPAR